MKSLVKLLLGVILITGMAFAQDKKADAPKLKDSVVANLRTLQLQQSQIRARKAELQLEYNQLMSQESQVNSQLAAAMGTALKNSDLDETTHTINPVTLEVTVKPSPEKKDK